jgi:hypothetical protein
MNMLRILTFLILVTSSLRGQSQVEQANKVSFVTNIDIRNATKDGIYLNGYVVNIPYARLKKLNGKKVRIRGRVRTIIGLKNEPEGDIRGGRLEDYYYMEKPKVKILG